MRPVTNIHVLTEYQREIPGLVWSRQRGLFELGALYRPFARKIFGPVTSVHAARNKRESLSYSDSEAILLCMTSKNWSLNFSPNKVSPDDLLVLSHPKAKDPTDLPMKIITIFSLWCCKETASEEKS
jgi:hypothetical protein